MTQWMSSTLFWSLINLEDFVCAWLCGQKESNYSFFAYANLRGRSFWTAKRVSVIIFYLFNQSSVLTDLCLNVSTNHPSKDQKNAFVSKCYYSPSTADVEMEKERYLKIFFWHGNSTENFNFRVLFHGPCTVFMPRLKLPKPGPAQNDSWASAMLYHS